MRAMRRRTAGTSWGQELSRQDALTIARIVRVNHAGEFGAIRIYSAQILVAKRMRSPYREGPERSVDWLKIKRQREADFVVSGFTEANGGVQFVHEVGS